MALAMLRHLKSTRLGVMRNCSICGGQRRQKLGDSDEMWVSQAVVNCGPIYKRVLGRDQMGAMQNSIQKRTSHITIAVAAPNAAHSS